ncbi:glutathionylspermidine synthase family protein [Streptomyces sp. PmtG]
MERRTTTPRPGWQRTVEEQGLSRTLIRHADGVPRPYWDESAYYVFTRPEVRALAEVVEELHAMCLAAAAHLVERGRLADVGITDARLAALVTQAWHRRAELPSLYGRLDLRYDGGGPAKLVKYDADTPTSLVEAARAQRFWREERFPGAGQWNSLHESLVAAWRGQARLLPQGSPVHFAHSAGDGLGEDLMTVAYLRETAAEAGLATESIRVEDIGWDRLSGRFVDLRLGFIRSCFKLYPWESLTTDRFAPYVLDTLGDGGGTGTTLWIEPVWKLLLSSEALLAVLWELYPGHPNLLPEPVPLPEFPPERDGNRVVLGAWIVADEAAGLGIREHPGPAATGEYPRFVPHVVL